MSLEEVRQIEATLRSQGLSYRTRITGAKRRATSKRRNTVLYTVEVLSGAVPAQVSA